MPNWNDEVKNCTVSKQEILDELKREMQMRLKVYGEWIRKGKIKQDIAIKRCAALKLAYRIIKVQLDSEVGVQKELF